MLRNIGEVNERSDGRFDARLKCGHMVNYKFKTRPKEDSPYNCPACDIKGQGISHIIGYLNNRSHRKGHD
jgi:hypothetical protein